MWWPFKGTRQIVSEEFPKYSRKQYRGGLKIYGDLRALYGIFDQERNRGMVRGGLINVIDQKIKDYESNVPEEIRSDVESSGNGYSVEKIKKEMARARHIAE